MDCGTGAKSAIHDCLIVLCSSITEADVVDGDKLRLNCSVSYADYFGYLTPHYNWTVSMPSDDEDRPVLLTEDEEAEDSGVAYLTASWPAVPPLRCSVHFNGGADKPSYSDAASNAPSYRGECATDTVDVLGPPRRVRVVASSPSGTRRRRLRCSAAGRPAPTYEWRRVTDDDRRPPVVVGDLLELNDTGRHQVRCTAVNVIRGVEHRRASEPVVVVVPSLPPPTSFTHASTESGLGNSNRSVIHLSLIHI